MNRLTDRAIDHRIAAGRLHRIHRGVYSVGHTLLLPRARYMAAVLVCGSQAVLNHKSAAAHVGMRGPHSGPIDVMVLRGGSRNRRGIALHVTRSLPDHHVTKEDGIPSTTPMRTLVDLAAVVRHPRELGRALERSLELSLFDGDALEDVLTASNGRRGTGLLRQLLADLHDAAAPVASELERRFLELVRKARLPHPIVNGHIGELQVDFHWPAYRIVVETDGRATHGHAIAFRRDRARDLDLDLADWHVIRLTWRQIVGEPERVTAALRRRLRPR